MVPLASRTRAAVEQAVDGRDGGPLLRNRWGNRMTRNDLAAAVATLATHPDPTPRALHTAGRQSRVQPA